MVLDTSAIVAIHLREPGHERLIDRIEVAEVVVVGVPTVLETAMVLTARLGQDARPMVFALLRRLDAAITAFIRFGRGRHPAALNFGHCMSYEGAPALAGNPGQYPHFRFPWEGNWELRILSLVFACV